LDDFGRPAAAGVEGEIFCSGDSVALGYLNDDAGRNRAFRLASSLGPGVDPKGEIVYATGDYGRITDAGELVFLGRRDS
jgi:non-ribosomal peptide synthetase component F